MTMDNTCPSCGQPLVVVALGWDSAPWLCQGCSQGFWPSELTAESRKHWRREWRAFTWPEWPAIAASVDQDQARARERGTSLVPEHAAFLSRERRQRESARLRASFAAERCADVLAALGEE